MIVFLKGTVCMRGRMFLDLDVQGVGYRVFVTEQFAQAADLQQDIFVYTYHHVREDAVVLYGFATDEDRRLFEMLLGVSGIGPKGSLQILSAISVNDLVGAIRSENVQTLYSLPGIGKKTAQRLIVELKDKVDTIPTLLTDSRNDVLPSSVATSTVEGDVLAALQTLGYPERTAFDVVHRILVLAPELSVEDALKQCLQALYVHGSLRR